MTPLAEGYAKVAIWQAGTSQPVDYSAIVRQVRPGGQTFSAYRLSGVYDGYLTMDWRVTEADDTELSVVNIEAFHIVVYLDYFHTDGRPWFPPPQSSQDSFTIPPGWKHTFSANAFLKIRGGSDA